MTMIAVVSAGGAPGATTTALALTLGWPEPALMAECDSDGSSVLAGLFAGHVPADRGLLNLALRLTDDRRAADTLLLGQTLLLDGAGERLVLPGPADPFQAQAISAVAWQQIAELLASQQLAVIADAGQVRAVGYPFAVLAAARLIVMVLRPTLRQVVAAQPRLAAIRQALGEDIAIGLCVIGQGDYSISQLRSALGGDFVVVLQLPVDDRSAARLSDGAQAGRSVSTGELLMQARSAARVLSGAVARLPVPRHRRWPSTVAPGGGGSS